MYHTQKNWNEQNQPFHLAMRQVRQQLESQESYRSGQRYKSNTATVRPHPRCSHVLHVDLDLVVDVDMDRDVGMDVDVGGRVDVSVDVGVGVGVSVCALLLLAFLRILTFRGGVAANRLRTHIVVIAIFIVIIIIVVERIVIVPFIWVLILQCLASEKVNGMRNDAVLQVLTNLIVKFKPLFQ